MAARLEGRVALITGAGSGIGKAYCLRFAQEGARVVAVDIDEERVNGTAEELGEAGVGMHADVSSAAEVFATVQPEDVVVLKD